MKLYSGLIELKQGWVVRLPYPMNEYDLFAHLTHYRHDPITLTVIAAGAAIGGQVYSGMAARAEEKSAAAMETYKADLAMQEAKQIEQATQYKQMRKAEEFARRQSSLEAQLGASGAVAGEGAPLMIAAQQEFESERELLMEGYEGSVSASRARSRAAGHRFGAKIAKQRGRSKMTSAMFGAGRSLITGFQEYREVS